MMLSQFFDDFGHRLLRSRLLATGPVCLLTAVLLSGCLSAPIKLSDPVRSQLRTLRVVAVEAPPLEVIPDLLQTRMPVYAHYDNMALPVTTESVVYRLPGGIRVAGHVGEGDSVEIVDSAEATASMDYADWLPTSVLVQEAVAQLRAARLQVLAEPRRLSLPLTLNDRDANLVGWRDAVAQWYGLDPASVGDAAEPVDAIMELGIGRYRIFNGQISLQVLIKLIDANSGQVIARTEKQSAAYEAPIEALLARQGETFKARLRQRASELLAQGFRDIGLTAQSR